MDNWMAPRAFGAGGKVKPARQGKSSSSAHQSTTAVGASGEEAGAGPPAMGLLKRKRTTPPESPAPSKKRISEDAELQQQQQKSCTSEAVEGTQRKIQTGKQPSTPLGDARVNDQQSGQTTESTVDEPFAEDAARLRFEKDVDALQSRVPAVVENVSYGQESSFRARPAPEASAPAMVPGQDGGTESLAIPHVVPSHAGWFQWARVHQLERLALPEYFSGKEDSKKTPELYMEHRSCIMKKYRENPKKLIKFEDLQGLLTGDVSGAARLFAFLDHWGLINYQAIIVFSPFSSSRLLSSGEETNNGAVSYSPNVKPALTHLFNFEAALAPAHKLPSINPSPVSNLPISSLADAAVQESLSAPAVEYHCNSCQADCSKRRYHCQKQADFDLCPDCYSDGKFGQGMTGTDFLRMDALTEFADANGGGWSDQETLLLLEALELYGDNWTEIAEHVATKSKAQCILHFIRLPIEDPFLEDMEGSKSVSTVRPPATVVSNESMSSLNDRGAQIKGAEETSPSARESIEAFPSNSEQGASGSIEAAKKNEVGKNGNDDSEPSSMKTEGKFESDAPKESGKGGQSGEMEALLVVSESAGCTGPDGLIAFADAGNPVMTQVAFLAAMVGPSVAAAAAQAALKSLAEDNPVGFLSVKNSFPLDGSDSKDVTLDAVLPESRTEVSLHLPRSSEQLSTENQLVTSSGGPTLSSHNNSTSETAEDKTKDVEMVMAGTLEKAAGQEARPPQKSQVTAATVSSIAELDVPSTAKVRTAAANALASAAVKAKLLADQEEREIQRLVAVVIENQLKKLELKLKHFSELESMLGKECEQAEKARAKVYAERARIMASRLGPPPSASQVQAAGSTGASFSKPSSQSGNLVAAQPRPAVFTFGPGGNSAPAAGYSTTSGVQSSSSMPASTSSQQGVTPQRPPTAVSGTSLAMAAKK